MSNYISSLSFYGLIISGQQTTNTSRVSENKGAYLKKADPISEISFLNCYAVFLLRLFIISPAPAAAVSIIPKK